LTDNIIKDIDEVKQMLINAQNNLPVSVSLVGIGNKNFDAYTQL